MTLVVERARSDDVKFAMECCAGLGALYWGAARQRAADCGMHILQAAARDVCLAQLWFEDQDQGSVLVGVCQTRRHDCETT